jgi:hypothetical protein
MLGKPDLQPYLFVIKPSLSNVFFHVAHIRKPSPDRGEIRDGRRSLFTISIFRNA